MMRFILLAARVLPFFAVTPANAQSAEPVTECSPDALSADERAAMEREYVRRLRAEGKKSADAWVAQQGQAFHQRLVDQGICPAPRDSAPLASSDRQESRETLKAKDGTPCRTTRLENRNIANLGGGAMSMVLVPVCVD